MTKSQQTWRLGFGRLGGIHLAFKIRNKGPSAFSFDGLRSQELLPLGTPQKTGHMKLAAVARSSLLAARQQISLHGDLSVDGM